MLFTLYEINTSILLFISLVNAQFTPIYDIPSNFSGFEIKAFETNQNGHLMIVTRPYDGGPTTDLMVYNSADFGQTWDSTFFSNESMMRDNAFVTEGGNLFFTTMVNVQSTTNPPGYQRKVLHASLDNGVTWFEKTIDSIQGANKKRSLSFLNDSTGMFFYQNGMYLTNDYGMTWQYVDTIYPNSLGLFDDKFVYYGNLDVYTYVPITNDRQTQIYDPFCEGFVNQSEYKNGTSYNSLFAWNGTILGPQYNFNFASLNIDALPLGSQKIVHFPQRVVLSDISITNSCINMVLDGFYTRSNDGGDTFYDVDAFNGNTNESAAFIEFVNDTLGFIISQNLITFEWQLWKTTNGGGSNSTQLLTNSFSANVTENKSEISFDLFPNPVASDVNILSPDFIEMIKIYSIDGKEVISKEVNLKSLNVDLSSFSSGTYIIKIFSKKGTASRRIIKK